MKKVILSSTLLAVLLTAFSFDMNAAVIKKGLEVAQAETWGADYLAQVIEFDMAAIKNALTNFKKDHPNLYSKYFYVIPEIPTIPATSATVVADVKTAEIPAVADVQTAVK